MKILSYFKEFYKPHRVNLLIFLQDHEFNAGFPLGFPKENICGGGWSSSYLRIMLPSQRMCSGSGSNTWAKLLSLWGLLSFASNRNIPSVQNFGDSKIIVDWENGHYVLQVASLDHWCNNILELMESFNTILIKHIYHE